MARSIYIGLTQEEMEAAAEGAIRDTDKIALQDFNFILARTHYIHYLRSFLNRIYRKG